MGVRPQEGQQRLLGPLDASQVALPTCPPQACSSEHLWRVSRVDRPRVARAQDRPWSASSRYRRGFPAPQMLDASPASGAQSRTCRATGACAEGTRASLRNPSTARAEAPGWVSGDPSLCWEQRLDPACGPGLAWPQRLPPSPAGAQRLLRLARGDTPHTRGGVGGSESTRGCAHRTRPAKR